MQLASCCDEARMDPQVNTRHIWTADEANDRPFNGEDRQ